MFPYLNAVPDYPVNDCPHPLAYPRLHKRSNQRNHLWHTQILRPHYFRHRRIPESRRLVQNQSPQTWPRAPPAVPCATANWHPYRHRSLLHWISVAPPDHLHDHCWVAVPDSRWWVWWLRPESSPVPLAPLGLQG